MKKLFVLLLGTIMCLAVISTGFASGAKEGAATETEKVAAGVEKGIQVYSTIADYEKATGNKITQFGEAPELAELVKAGKLPPVEQRISDEPLVISPKDHIGKYGGMLRGGATGPGGGGADLFLSRCQPLVILLPDMKTIVPHIIKGWDFSDDFKTFTLYLRKGMKYSDGAQLTAEDYLFWYNDILLNDDLRPVKPRHFSPGGEPMKVEKVDDYTVRFHFAIPYPVILDILSVAVEQVWRYPFQPKHYLKEYHINYNKDADKLAKDAGFDSWAKNFNTVWERPQFERRPDYPIVNAWAPTRKDQYGNRYYDRNPYYWKIDTAGNQLPYIDVQAFMLVESREVWNLKVISGDLDFAAQHTAIENYPIFKEGEQKGGYNAYVWPFDRGVELCNFKFNQFYPDPVMRELFRDVRFRKAVSLALDRDEVNKVVYYGRALARQGTIIPGVSFYEDWMGDYFAKRDVGQANQLLDELGLKWDASKQYRLLPDGKPLALNLEFAEYAGARTKMLELSRDALEEVGIKVGLKTVQMELYSQRNAAGALPTSMWNLDATTEIGFHRRPTAFLPNAQPWTLWLDSGGVKGEEPPQVLKDYWDLSIKFQQTLLGSDEYKKLGKQLVTIALENFWNIAIVGQIPKPAVIKKDLVNAPREEGVWSWDYRFWTPFQTDQWFWK